MILGLQIVSFVFAFIMIYFAYVNFRKREIDANDFYIWIIIWISVLLIVVFPELLRDFSSKFLITRLFDLMVVGGFLLIISMSAKVYVRSKRIEKKMEEFLRKDAIKNVKKPSRRILKK